MVNTKHPLMLYCRLWVLGQVSFIFNKLYKMNEVDDYLLVQAAGTGQLNIVKHMVESGYNYNWKHPQAAYTALHAAAGNGWDKILCYLLSIDDIDPDPVNATGRTPLHYAARIGHIPSIVLLLRAGANPNAKDNVNETPISMAKRIGHVRAYGLLIGIDMVKIIDNML